MRILLVLLVVMTAAVCGARDLTVELDGGRKVMLLEDNTWEFVHEKSFDGTLPEQASLAVGVWDAYLKHEKGKYGMQSVGLFIDYVNRTALRIVGVAAHVIIRDPFGNVLNEFTREDPVAIHPKGRLKNNLSLAWKDNPFVEGEMYDKLAPAALHKTVQVEARIVKVVFEDGTVLSDKSPGKMADAGVPAAKN